MHASPPGQGRTWTRTDPRAVRPGRGPCDDDGGTTGTRGGHRVTVPPDARSASRARPGPAGFLQSRWRAEVPLRIVFWRDMLGFGTTLNVLATFVALMAASQGSPTWLAVVLHFLPLPYNLFLFGAVARSRPRRPAAVAAAAVWLAVMTVI